MHQDTELPSLRPPTKRVLLSNALVSLGVVPTILSLRRRTRTPWLTVLTYHRIGAKAPSGLLDQEVMEAEPDVFDRQIAFLSRSFDIIGMDDLTASLEGKSLPPSPLLLTFDDGYLDNYQVALPILKKHGARATFFIATSYIDERRLFWWDRINYLIKSCRRGDIDVNYPTRMILDLRAGRAAQTLAIEAMLGVVKNHFALDLPRFLEELAIACDVEISRPLERALADMHLMTWNEVRGLRAAGMDVQSHTLTHRVLQTLGPAELAQELSESRMILESALREPVRAVSYPVGSAASYSDAIRNAVRAAGYQVGFSNRAGVNRWSEFDPLDVKRLRLDTQFSDSHFQAPMALPALAY